MPACIRLIWKSFTVANTLANYDTGLITTVQTMEIGNCNIFLKQKILVINETKQDEITLKPKVCDWENLHGIP
jgi:hypothetical protein